VRQSGHVPCLSSMERRVPKRQEQNKRRHCRPRCWPAVRFRRWWYPTQIVPEPFHQRPRDNDTSLPPRSSPAPPKLVSNRCDQSALRLHDALPCIHQEEASRTIGVFRFSFSKANLADEGRLLISQNAGNRHVSKWPFFDSTYYFGTRADARQHRLGNMELTQQISVPCQGSEIHELRAARVCDIGYVHTSIRPASQLPNEKAIHSSEQHISSLCPVAETRHVLEHPDNFQAAEICAEGQAGASSKSIVTTVGCKP